jgi:DNA invertase Pin-like site-specific DNA recombinase
MTIKKPRTSHALPPATTPATAAYIRVSTASQNEAGQRREIDRWLIANSLDTATIRYYIDKESGDTLDRPAFDQLQADIFNGLVHSVVLYKLDRLSRSLQDGINTLCDWCQRGIRVVSITQQLDFNGTVGKLIAAVLFAVAEMEQQTRRERQAAGIAAAKARGAYTGRPRGATKKGVDTARAHTLRTQGLSIPEIANALNASPSSIKRYLKLHQ